MNGTPVFACAVLLCALLGGGCESLPLGNDLADAKKAIQSGDMSQAQKLLERHLRVEENPVVRWETWNTLLKATEQANPSSTWIVDYLETMLMEFEDSPEKSRVILQRLAEAHEVLRRFERAAETWTRLLEEPGLNPDEQAAVYRRLAKLSLRLRHFERAEDFLQSCMALPIASGKQAECLFDLADATSMRGDINHAAVLARQVMDMDDADTILKARAGFILADIKDEQGQNQEALALFESIKGIYPNELVVEKRIALLKKKPAKTL